METPKTREGRREAIKQIASKKLGPEDVKPGRKVSEEFWKTPKPKDPEGLALHYLLEDRREGR